MTGKPKESASEARGNALRKLRQDGSCGTSVAAAILGCSTRTLLTKTKEGRIRAVMYGSFRKSPIYTAEEVFYVEANGFREPPIE